MEENNEEVTVTEESTEKEETGFDIKAVLPIFVGMALVAAFAYFFLLPALQKADHSPTSVIEQSQDGDTAHELLEQFK